MQPADHSVQKGKEPAQEGANFRQGDDTWRERNAKFRLRVSHATSPVSAPQAMPSTWAPRTLCGRRNALTLQVAVYAPKCPKESHESAAAQDIYLLSYLILEQMFQRQGFRLCGQCMESTLQTCVLRIPRAQSNLLDNLRRGPVGIANSHSTADCTRAHRIVPVRPD